MNTIKNHIYLASQILGIHENAIESEIRYSYYRLMCSYHPDKNQDETRANHISALINEAKDIMLGREMNTTLLKDKDLVAELTNMPVSDENIMSYEQWLKKQFFNMEEYSIWAY